MGARDIVLFFRINQWYKNIIIFLAIVFSGNLLDKGFLIQTLMGFLVLCMVSSSYYIVNDVIDRKRDMFHAEKSKRPIASGKIKVGVALVIAAVLLFLGMMFSAALSGVFFWLAVFLFGFTMLYSFVLKRIKFVDMAAIGVNFMVRAVAGAFIISVWISPYLVAIPFFFSLYLSAGKRYSDLVFSGQNMYKKKTLKLAVWLFFVLLIASFAVYSIVVHPLFLTASPFVVYALFRYNGFIFSGSKLARRTELMFTDLRLLISLIGFCAVIFAVLY